MRPERTPYVVVLFDPITTAETPIATINAESDGDANAWAYTLYGCQAFCYPRTKQYEAQGAEFVATHKGRLAEIDAMPPLPEPRPLTPMEKLFPFLRETD